VLQPGACTCLTRDTDGKSAASKSGGSGQQKKRSVPAVDDKRMRALAAAMVRESERETLQGIRLELEQVCNIRPIPVVASPFPALRMSSSRLRLQVLMTAWERQLQGLMYFLQRGILCTVFRHKRKPRLRMSHRRVSQLRLLLERVSKRERLKRERFHVLRDTWTACLEDPGPGLALLRAQPPPPAVGATPAGPSPAVAPLELHSQPLQPQQACS